MGKRLWELRTDLVRQPDSRVLLCVYRGHLVALHGFIKKTRATPDEDLAMEVVAWHLAEAMKKKKILMARMAVLLKTSRAQVDRMLNPKNDITLLSF